MQACIISATHTHTHTNKQTNTNERTNTYTNEQTNTHLTTYKVIGFKDELFPKFSIFILPKHTSTDNIGGVLVKLLKRDGSHCSTNATSNLSAGKANEIRNRK